MEAICCICEKGIADDIAQAALHNGAPGPTVTFGRVEVLEIDSSS